MASKHNINSISNVIGVRVFRGDSTRQLDYQGQKADPEKWYYEPASYDGDMLWSVGFGSQAEAYHAAEYSVE